MPSRGPKKMRNCYVTPIFSRLPRIGNKMRGSYITPAFSGWTLLLRNPCFVGAPRNRGQNQKWLHQAHLPRGPKVGTIAT